MIFSVLIRRASRAIDSLTLFCVLKIFAPKSLFSGQHFGPASSKRRA